MLLAPAWQDVCMGWLFTDFVSQTASTLQFRSGLDALPWRADLEALLGLNPLFLPLDLATFFLPLPAKNFLRGNYVSLAIPVLLTLKWEEECHFPTREHQEMFYFCLMVKTEELVGHISLSQSCFC